ncbi:hypothetical protein N7523_001939 [Penicillium sp. IBT 18751x]|nr:hypothetical protein N7523_001939 [Penicillium sp. IBT 18751x]
MLTASIFLGVFTVDMAHATGGSGRLPTLYTASTGSAMSDDGITNDSNWPSITHALCLCGALILFMPTGVVFLRMSPKSVRWHWVNQTLTSAMAILGIIIGFYLGIMFTKSRSYDSAHQILEGRTQSLTKLGPIHRYLGYVIIFLAIVNGGLGLTWSYASKSVVTRYSIVVAIIGAGLVAVFAWARMASRRDQTGLIGNPSELRQFQGRDNSDSIDLVQEADRAPENHYKVYTYNIRTCENDTENDAENDSFGCQKRPPFHRKFPIAITMVFGG